MQGSRPFRACSGDGPLNIEEAEDPAAVNSRNCAYHSYVIYCFHIYNILWVEGDLLSMLFTYSVLLFTTLIFIDDL